MEELLAAGFSLALQVAARFRFLQKSYTFFSSFRRGNVSDHGLSARCGRPSLDTRG